MYEKVMNYTVWDIYIETLEYFEKKHLRKNVLGKNYMI